MYSRTTSKLPDLIMLFLLETLSVNQANVESASIEKHIISANAHDLLVVTSDFGLDILLDKAD